MFAVIETGGKQYLVKEGSTLKVEKIEAKPGEGVEINKVLCVSSNGLSCPTKATVKAEVLEQKRAEKVVIFKKKRRKNYRRKAGHRQYITVLRINEIVLQKQEVRHGN